MVILLRDCHSSRSMTRRRLLAVGYTVEVGFAQYAGCVGFKLTFSKVYANYIIDTEKTVKELISEVPEEQTSFVHVLNSRKDEKDSLLPYIHQASLVPIQTKSKTGKTPVKTKGSSP